MQHEVSIPWRACLLSGVAFGVALSLGVQHDNCLWALIRFLEFHKLGWHGIFGFGIVLVLLMVKWPATLGNSRARLGVFVSFIFNGVVGGYLGIAIWNFHIGQIIEGIDFLGWAWVAYVWFFLTLNVVKHGVPSHPQGTAN